MVFAGVVIALIALIALGNAGAAPLQQVGAGVTLDGLPCFVAHDGLVH